MMKKLSFYLLSILLLSSCIDSNDEEFRELNHWVYEGLYSYYFWYDKIDDHIIPGSEYPEDYFYRLLYDEEDKWSYITNNYSGLNSELQGEPVSMGYSPSFGRIAGSDHVFMIIEYVYQNSPAHINGLKRGNIVTKINGVQLNIENYIDLFRSKNQVLTLAELVAEGIRETNTTISLEAEMIEVNPVVFYAVYEQAEVNVGYCVITDFIAYESFVEDVGEVFNFFKENSIQELIIDLRYNGGGYLNSAQWLASSIAPQSVMNDKSVITNLVYNDKVEGMIPEDELTVYFVESFENLDLSSVYFLTTGNTASASELTIIGLLPYMDVTLIGDNTYGKYTGSWVIPDFNDPPHHNWAMLPIVMKYANADGFTDFKEGIEPDYYVEDNLLEAVPFGDITDPLLSKALMLAGGIETQPPVKSGIKISQVEYLSKRWNAAKMNLYMEISN